MKLKTAILISIAILMILGCSVSKTEKKYPVRSVEHLSGNVYKVSTDSFKVIRYVRGAGKYHPDSVTKKGVIE